MWQHISKLLFNQPFLQFFYTIDLIFSGQADTVRELLTNVPATVKSESPTGQSLVPELGSESGMTPLHLASYSGNENVVRLLLNSAGVQVDAATSENVSFRNIKIGRNW